MGTARNPDFTDDDILLDRVRLVDDILFVNRGKRKFVASTLSPTPEGIDEALAVLAERDAISESEAWRERHLSGLRERLGPDPLDDGLLLGDLSPALPTGRGLARSRRSRRRRRVGRA